MSVTLFHNPRCSKSRQTLAILQQQQLEFEVVEYLKTPLDKPTLLAILEKLDMPPSALLRKGEAVYKELGLAEHLDDDEVILAAMIAHPILIERPIVLANDRACIGRPPESVLSIL